MIKSGNDAEIDDPELLGSKKFIAQGNTPGALVHILAAKWHDVGKLIGEVGAWETKDHREKKSVWHFKIGIRGTEVIGYAADYNKNKAKHLAC